ncbi:hypothetical protein V6Z11_D04G148700 [Gossypium hirsutum]
MLIPQIQSFLLLWEKFTTRWPSTSMKHCFVKLSPIVENSLLLSPIRVWVNSSFCSSVYRVLEAVSSYCSPPKGRFLCVTYPFDTENTTSNLTCIC